MAGSVAQHPCSRAAARIYGSRITRIDRVFFQSDGAVDPDDGPIELHLDDGSVFLFDGEPDGETLRVRALSWCDPFEGKLSMENEAFVAESGKWVRVAVSDEAPYNDLINVEVCDVEVLKNRFGNVAGFAIKTSVRTLWFVVQGDEARAYWAAPLGFRARKIRPSSAD